MVDNSNLQVVIIGIGIRKEGDRDDIYERVRRVVRTFKTVLEPAKEPKGSK